MTVNYIKPWIQMQTSRGASVTNVSVTMLYVIQCGWQVGNDDDDDDDDDERMYFNVA